jgi:iron-sulfur cluster assembly accessory protein
MTETINIESPIRLTASASDHVRSLLTQPENAGKSLRVYVEQGGCSGMQYGLVFDERRDGDLVAGQDGVTVLLDPFSAKYVHGAIVDFSDALTGGGFKISNPNAKQSCGCGKSFET